MVIKLNKCLKCGEYDENGSCIGVQLPECLAGAVDIQIKGLCDVCQERVADRIEIALTPPTPNKITK